jgi:hypothetical protein
MADGIFEQPESFLILYMAEVLFQVPLSTTKVFISFEGSQLNHKANFQNRVIEGHEFPQRIEK